MIGNPDEYEAIARLFDLVSDGNGELSELERLDSQIAKGLELAYQSEDAPAAIDGMAFMRRATSLS
jgi:hypothetical protein